MLRREVIRAMAKLADEWATLTRIGVAQGYPITAQIAAKECAHQRHQILRYLALPSPDRTFEEHVLSIVDRSMKGLKLTV